MPLPETSGTVRLTAEVHIPTGRAATNEDSILLWERELGGAKRGWHLSVAGAEMLRDDLARAIKRVLGE